MSTTLDALAKSLYMSQWKKLISFVTLSLQTTHSQATKLFII